MTIGQRIKLKREALNIKQSDLARMVNVSKQTLYKYENDIVTNIPIATVEEIASVLGVSPVYIVGWSDTESVSGFSTEAVELYNKYLGSAPNIRSAIDQLLSNS